MFWNRKPKSPITPEDQIWVEDSFQFLIANFGEDHLLTLKTVEPTKEFFNRDFDGSEEDAHFILVRCLELMGIKKEAIVLEFYSENSRHLDDGTLLSTTADSMGRSKGAAGTYQIKEGITLIRLERAQLKQPELIIATISHELAHEKLLGEKRIQENDEYLTDLTAIAFGFGIFIANAKFQFESNKGNGFGWQMKSQGYLPEQLIAYAMASLSLHKNENNTDYSTYLGDTSLKYFKQSLGYLKSKGYKKEVKGYVPSAPKLSAEDFIEKPNVIKPVPELNVSNEALKKLQEQLFYAVNASDFNATENILEQGVSPNFTFTLGIPLNTAVSNRNIAMIDLLIQYNADVNYKSDSSIFSLPLVKACEAEDILIINKLLNLGAKVNLITNMGNNALKAAVLTGNESLVLLILENGGDIEGKIGATLIVKDSNTAICYAALNNDVKMVELLLKQGAKTKPLRKLPRQKSADKRSTLSEKLNTGSTQLRPDLHPKMVKFLKSKKYI